MGQPPFCFWSSQATLVASWALQWDIEKRVRVVVKRDGLGPTVHQRCDRTTCRAARIGRNSPGEESMMNRRTVTLGMTMALLVFSAAACSEQQQGTTTSQIEEKTFTVKPATSSLRVGFLTGQLADLKIVESVNQQTREVVTAPRLRGTLKLRNETSDQTARMISGSLEFLDADGQPILLAAEREAPRFTFHSYSGDRLDPGMETSQDLDVSFPAAALDGQRLADIRVKVNYIPDPYRAESATVPVSLAP